MKWLKNDDIEFTHDSFLVYKKMTVSSNTEQTEIKHTTHPLLKFQLSNSLPNVQTPIQ